MKVVMMLGAFLAMTAFFLLIGLSDKPSYSAYQANDRVASFQQ